MNLGFSGLLIIRLLHFLFYHYFPIVTLKSIQDQRECQQCSNKLPLIKSYNRVQKYDIICISETFLDSLVNENPLLIPGYDLLRADHPKRNKVYVYISKFEVDWNSLFFPVYTLRKQRLYILLSIVYQVSQLLSLITSL